MSKNLICQKWLFFLDFPKETFKFLKGLLLFLIILFECNIS